MKVFLMHPEADFELEEELPANTEALMQDLELDVLFQAMAQDDKFLYRVAQQGILRSLVDREIILYRQRVLTDCRAQPQTVRELYALAVEAIDGERKIHWGFFRDWPDAILRRSLQVLEFFVPLLRRLRGFADERAGGFKSDGFRRLFATLQSELGDDYFELVEDHLKELHFRIGLLISASLTEGNKGTDYVLRQVPERTWVERLLGDRQGYGFQIAERDEAGTKALSELRDRGENITANALAQSVDHILSFFTALRIELGFYIGCLNLQDTLDSWGAPTSAPTPTPLDTVILDAQGLYDVTLALTVNGKVVGNDLSADGKLLVMITGANQGGKSTLLRAIGVAQLMMQCGMFTPAEAFRANVCNGIFTHYKREEDAEMTSGKLDEELKRMSQIADAITPGCLLLCNESFASTNEREGSEIARQIIRSMIEARIKVIYVTHLYDLAHGFFREGLETALFLRAERGEEGRRTYKLPFGEPIPTSHGEDTYRREFATPARPNVSPPAAESS